MITMLLLYILSQSTNANGKTSLDNSKSNRYMTKLFEPWLDKCISHLIFEFERSLCFHAHSAVAYRTSCSKDRKNL